MQPLDIPPTASTPAIQFDFSSHELRIEGESHPENVTSFYAPILEKLDAYLAELPTGQSCRFDFALVYFNSSSAKIVMTIMEKLEDAAQAGKSIIVRWYYDDEDDTMLELGEEFGSDLEAAEFELVRLND